ncbi:Gustatory receptor 141 [Hyalella azteca]|uniref:Gustatory receptor 141 n=1 Tax=Hyalella azteca TaxID=294128 RepID=A0A6A0GWT8_HYAAZ|nr:Gustatory receptor 141 [Hyalella azteca]
METHRLVVPVVEFLLWLSGLYVPRCSAAVASSAKTLSRDDHFTKQAQTNSFSTSCYSLALLWVMMINFFQVFMIVVYLNFVSRSLNTDILVTLAYLWIVPPTLLFIIESVLFHRNRKLYLKLVRRLKNLSIAFGRVKDGRFYCGKFVGMAGVYGIMAFSGLAFMLFIPTAMNILIGAHMTFLGLSFTVILCSFYISITIVTRTYTFLNEKIQVKTTSMRNKICDDHTSGCNRRCLERRAGQAAFDVDKEDNLLYGFEENLIYIQDTLVQIQTFYSIPLLLGNSILMANVIIGFFLLLNACINNEFKVQFWCLTGVSVWSLAFLLMMHTCADQVNSARQDLAWSVRKLLCVLRPQAVAPFQSSVWRALAIIAEPFQFSMAGFSGIGRGALTNTVAFTVSYVIVALQFQNPLLSVPPEPRRDSSALN